MMATLAELLLDSRDGEWGAATAETGTSAAFVIRGTDFASVAVGNVSGVPLRYVEDSKIERKVLRDWDVLIEAAGGTKSCPPGRTLLIRPAVLQMFDRPTVCASFARYLRVDRSRAEPAFVYYLLRQMHADGRMLPFVTQHTGVSRFQYTKFAQQDLSLPSLSIQARTASVLLAYDDLIENNTKRISVLEEMARVLYREWFITRYDVQWATTNLGLVADVNRESISLKDPPDSIRYVDISSVSTGYVDDVPMIPFASAPGRARRVVRHGATIWSCVRPNRRSHALMIEPADGTIVSTGFAVLTPRQLSPAYLYLATTTEAFVAHLEAHATGAAYPAVTASVFESAPITVPPPELRMRFEAIAMPLLEQADVLRRSNQRLRAARDLLLPKLLSGELSVDRIPDPAEALA